MTEDIVKNERKVEPKLTKLGMLGAVLAWLCVWPIAAAILVVIFAIGAGILFSTVLTDLEDPMLALKIVIFVGVIFLAVPFFIVARILRRTKTPFLRVGGVVLLVLTWIGVIGGGASLVFINNPVPPETATNTGITTQSADSFIIPTLQHDERLLAILADVGATQLDNVDERYVDTFPNPLVADQEGEYIAYTNPTNGAFLYGVLSIKKGMALEDEKITVAHEYLHHIWFTKLDDETIRQLTSQLIAMYGDDYWMQQRVSGYADNGSLQPTELFSYYCTESSDAYIRTYVLEQCNKYILRQNLQLVR